MYKLVVFDIDGTLLDTEKAILCALQKLIRQQNNIEYSAEELQFILGIPGKEALKRLKIADTAENLTLWNQNIARYGSYIQLFPDVEKTLKSLKKNSIKTGIVTSKTRQGFAADFSPFRLNSYFDFVVCADDTIKHKPHAEPLLKCLELADVIPEEAFYIGDTIYDSQCSASANVDFALAQWGTKNFNIPAKYKLNSPLEILAILKNQPFLTTI